MRAWLNIVQSSLIIFLLLPLPGIASEKIISVKSYKINSISSLGFRSNKIAVSVVIQNDSCDFFMENIQGTIYKKEKAILDVSMEDVYLSRGVVTINTNVTIIYRKGTSICSLICNLLFELLDDYSADVYLLCTMPDQEKSQINRHITWLDVSNP